MMEKVCFSVCERSGFQWSAGLEGASKACSSDYVHYNSPCSEIRRVWRLRFGGRTCGAPRLLCELGRDFQAVRYSSSPRRLLTKDADNRYEYRIRSGAWRDGANALEVDNKATVSGNLSGNALKLRRFLERYEGWEGEKALARTTRPIERKQKKHVEKISKMLKALEENPNIDEALGPWKGLLREKEQATLLGEQWRCDRALELFSWLKEQRGYRPNACHYNIMLKKCGHAGKWDLVQALWSEMQTQNVKPDSYTYNTLIDVNGKAGRKSEAAFWFESSKQLGLSDEVTNNTVINLCKEFEDCEKGKKLFESLSSIHADKNLTSTTELQGKDALEDNAELEGSKGRQGDMETLKSSSQHSFPIESSLHGEKHVEVAVNVLEAQESSNLKASELAPHPKNVHTYNIMMDLFGKAGRLVEASNLFDDMMKAGVDPNIVTYNTMMHICDRAGRVREAKSIFKKITEKGLVPDVSSYNTLITMFMGRGEKHKAYHYYRRMKEAGLAPNAITFRILLRNTMISAANFSASVNLSKHITSLMEELSSGIGELMHESELIQVILLNLYKKAGMKDSAVAVAKKMREADLSTNLVSYDSVLEMSVSVTEARQDFESMRRKQILPDISTYNRMAGVFKRAGLSTEALQEIENADSAGLLLNLHILTTAASLYSHAGMHEEAVEACEALRKCGSTLDVVAYNAMIYALGNAGRVDEALRISMEMQSRGIEADVVTHTTVITVYAKMGLLEGVSRVFKRMKRAGCVPDEISYKQLITIYKNAGREDLAAMVFQERQFARYMAKQYKLESTVQTTSSETWEHQVVTDSPEL